MHKKTTAWKNSIRGAVVQQNKAWKAINSTIPQTTKYPLSAMTLKKKECTHVMQPIVKFGLTKSGISSTLHTAVKYGTRSLRVIGLFDPFVIQRSGQIAFLVEHYWKSTPYIPLLRAKLSTLQLKAGIGGHILEKDYT